MNSKKVKSKKPRQNRTKPRRKNLVQISLLLTCLLLLIPIISYFFSKNDEPLNISKVEVTKQPIKKATNEEVMQEILAELEAKKKSKQAILKQDNIFEKELDINQKILDKVSKIKKNKEEIKQIETNKVIPTLSDKKEDTTSKQESYVYNKKNRPKIAIIIDDVISIAQKNNILNIGYDITMSFLPPTNRHKDSAKIAQNLEFYMVHFPLQASNNFKNEESNTLKITDSYETIENRVKQLRAWYPNAIYINNHTGSVFTQNDEAMDKLYRALIKYNFILVDSRTSPKSVAQKYSKQYNTPYIVRNVFLDDEKNFSAIKSQLIKAIEIAKERGYAVVIGHPHDVTLRVLKESKSLLKDVEPIFINELPYL